MRSRINKEAIHAPKFLNEPSEYQKSFSRGISVDVGPATFLFISGTASVDHRGRTIHKNDFIKQARRTFANLTALLASRHASWQDVVMTRCYLKDMGNYKTFNKIRNKFYRQKDIRPSPASVCIEANLCRPDLLVEIELVAVLKKSGSPDGHA